MKRRDFFRIVPVVVVGTMIARAPRPPTSLEVSHTRTTSTLSSVPWADTCHCDCWRYCPICGGGLELGTDANWYYCYECDTRIATSVTIHASGNMYSLRAEGLPDHG